jgi:hypothetical protein
LEHFKGIKALRHKAFLEYILRPMRNPQPSRLKIMLAKIVEMLKAILNSK